MDLLTKGILLFLVAVFSPVSSLFVPEQLPTLLSFIYTNIPPIRKGIDSRVGFGFRLGPNADVQVMLELGPQLNTAPVGPQKADGNSKRETRHPPYKYRPSQPTVKGSWLHAWRQQQTYVDNGEDVGVMPAQPAMDSDIVAHLQQLYKEQPMPDNAREAKGMKPLPNLQQNSSAAVQSGIELGTQTRVGPTQQNTQADTDSTTINFESVEETTQLVTNDQINNVPT